MRPGLLFLDFEIRIVSHYPNIPIGASYAIGFAIGFAIGIQLQIPNAIGPIMLTTARLVNPNAFICTHVCGRQSDSVCQFESFDTCAWATRRFTSSTRIILHTCVDDKPNQFVNLHHSAHMRGRHADFFCPQNVEQWCQKHGCVFRTKVVQSEHFCYGHTTRRIHVDGLVFYVP